MNVAKAKISENAYRPYDSLIDHLQKRLQIERKYREAKKVGRELSTEDTEERDRLIRMKVHVLNKYVFESMANITTFFEWCTNPILQEIFEDDIEELLVGANYNENLGLEFKSKGQPWLKTEYWDQPVITRFLHAIMMWNVRKDKHNFRLKVLSILVNAIGHYIITTTQQVLATEEDHSLSSTPAGYLANEKFHEIVNNELSRLTVFTEILAKNAKVKEGNPNRPVLF